LSAVDIVPCSTAQGGNPNQGEKHGIEESDQEAEEGQENECDQDSDHQV
jgi:hypothetical protein